MGDILHKDRQQIRLAVTLRPNCPCSQPESSPVLVRHGRAAALGGAVAGRSGRRAGGDVGEQVFRHSHRQGKDGAAPCHRLRGGVERDPRSRRAATARTKAGPGPHGPGGVQGRRPWAYSAAARSRLLSVRNCPHAANMSRPRGVRTGEEKPASMTMVAKRSMAAAVLVS